MGKVRIKKGSMMDANIRKTGRKPSSESLCTERKGRGGGGGGKRKREDDMSRSTHDNKGEAAVVVNGGHMVGGGEIGSVSIDAERTEDSSSSGIALKREGGDGGDEHRKEGGGGSSLHKRSKRLRVLMEGSSYPSSLQRKECRSCTKLKEMTTSSYPQCNNNVCSMSRRLRGTPTKERGGQNNNYVKMSRKLSIIPSGADDVVLSSYGINDSRVILEHGSSPRTPDGRTTRTTRRSNSVALNVEDMCFSNLLRRNSIYSPRPSLSTGHSPKPIRDACRTAILKNASASGVFPESPSEIDVDGLSQWLNGQKQDLGAVL